MTIDEWINGLPEDERESLCVADGWKAGAQAMLDAIMDRGYIGDNYLEDAKKAVSDILEVI